MVSNLAFKLPADRKFDPKPYAGWAFKQAVELDVHAPVLGSSAFYSGAKRQSFFLALASLSWQRPEALAERFGRIAPDLTSPRINPLAVIARALIVLRPKAIICAALDLDTPPPGLMGTLERLGDDPLGPLPAAYKLLARLFVEDTPANRARKKVLGQISGPVLREVVGVVQVLDPILLNPNALPYRIRDAAAWNHALALVRARCSLATDDAVRESVQSLNGPRIDAWLRRWMKKADQMPWPVPEGLEEAGFIALSTAPMMIETGERYRCCLRMKIGEVILGRHLYLEYADQDGDGGAIIELRRISTGWLCEGLYGPSNAKVNPDLAHLIRDKLQGVGIAFFGHAPGDPAALATLSEMLGIWGWSEDVVGGDADPLRELEADLREVIDQEAA